MSMRNKKDKYVAALLAFVAGIFGVHRFYLNQRGLAFLMIGITVVTFGILSAIISFIDTLLFLAMDSDQFDRKYNATNFEQENENFFYKSYHSTKQQKEKKPKKKRRNKLVLKEINQYRNSGIEHFHLYDFEESIEYFNKVLELDPYNVAANFNIACAYSQVEKPLKSMWHISRAVQAGYNDFDKIRNHEKLAYVRIQPEWEEFEKKGFLFNDFDSLGKEGTVDMEEVEESFEEESEENILESLKKLQEEREKGGISEEEFQLQRRKLMSS